jgi:hypothetical protein
MGEADSISEIISKILIFPPIEFKPSSRFWKPKCRIKALRQRKPLDNHCSNNTDYRKIDIYSMIFSLFANEELPAHPFFTRMHFL